MNLDNGWSTTVSPSLMMRSEKTTKSKKIGLKCFQLIQLLFLQNFHLMDARQQSNLKNEFVPCESGKYSANIITIH